MYTINKDTLFSLNAKKVIATNDFNISEDSKGIFILNYWEQCNCKDLDIKPVYYVESTDERDLYVLKRDNIILGDVNDICLI